MYSIRCSLLLPFLAIGLPLFFSCSNKSGKGHTSEQYSDNRERMEMEAQLYLNKARVALQQMKGAEAKKTIEVMRKKCYLAITARKEGILLMDSVDLLMARQELQRLDSVMQRQNTDNIKADFEDACKKVQFYERKLQFDKTNKH